MSVYQRFFIEIEPQNIMKVEQLIVSVLGGDAWIKRSADGNVLKPVEIVESTDEYVIPARTEYGGVITSVSSGGHWYWLDSIIEFDSPEAIAMSNGLSNSSYVKSVAEDNDCVEHEDAPAWIIRSH